MCGDTRHWSLKEDPSGAFYQPYLQTPNLGFGATYEIRTSLSPGAIVPSLRKAVQAIDPDLPLQDIRTQQEQIDASMQQERIIDAPTASFGMLACVSVYGVMAYSVAQRTSEIGIQMALGALPRQVLTMVLREGKWISVAGIACGIGASIFAARLVQSLLYGLKANDLVVFAGAVLCWCWWDSRPVGFRLVVRLPWNQCRLFDRSELQLSQTGQRLSCTTTTGRSRSEIVGSPILQ